MADFSASHSQQSNQPSRKTLVFRLSSLGDVVLSTAALSGPLAQVSRVDWVVAREFAPLLRGHPAIERVWEFDRSRGLAGWISLCRELAAVGYDDVLDLHSSLRTRVARLYFLLMRRKAAWRRFSKQRWRLYGLYLFHRRWPAAWAPRPFVERFAKFAGGEGGERPDLTHLASFGKIPFVAAEKALLQTRPYYCVMAGSKWDGKCWEAAKYFDVIRNAPQMGVPVILGADKDERCRELVWLLQANGIAHISGVGRWDLQQTAAVLAGATLYVGNDTGLAHLAEALGVPALVVYGPTVPQMGFAPWRERSQTVELSGVGCRPCGKDGRRCYRPIKKYHCMTGLQASQVTARFVEMRDRAP